MKKQSIFTIVALIAVLVMTSCNKYEAKETKLKTENDSLNYTLGLVNGKGIKEFYFANDSSKEAMKVLIQSIDQAFDSEASNDEIYTLGMQIGTSFKQQEKLGLMGDSTMKFNTDLVHQGLVNALKDFKEGMQAAEAEQYLQKVMMEIQAKKMNQQAIPQTIDSTANQSIQQ